MITAATSATYAASLTQTTEVSATKSSQSSATTNASSSTSSIIEDTVSISDQAQAILEESLKSYAQIKLDALRGNRIAQKLLEQMEARGNITNE